MFHPDTTVQSDLRGGCPPWLSGFKRPVRRELEHSLACDVLVVGAGITGALMAEHLSRLGREVILIDRERAGFGSTAASTAMLQWEIDCPLSELTGYYGFERAANIYRRSLQAVSGLKTLAEELQPSGFRQRRSLYLTGGDTGAAELHAEHVLRERAGLPGVYLDYLTLKREFGFDREAAIVSPGSADADPLLLAHALINSALAQGAVLYDAEAASYASFGHGVLVRMDNGLEVQAKHVVLATGYVMPEFMKTDLHKTASSWAIATPPQTRPDALWRDGALIWEASEDYLYARTTADNRIIIGGEDEDDIVDPDERDVLMPAKRDALLRKLKLLRPAAAADAAFIWSGAFGQTDDGLPLIGEVPDQPNLFAAYGYGGNGITFSYLASRIIGEMLAGRHEPWYDDFAIDRPPPVA
ncbi:FAD-binding oxidoreductase [Starkeya sp. ORNL1]|uniref:NAD(P)/FAD-dependent oxidoreductase n=1 Tax=Starkeya sp. ORNL1 TaxID=2709380 RepID=UPI0014646CEF|nr:FAD-binding oxidoreductase [Starkeya sp. ORNL1]QJP12593.1 FAD-binding oxidoreductase [Starkeya sp. ORNL1]